MGRAYVRALHTVIGVGTLGVAAGGVMAQAPAGGKALAGGYTREVRKELVRLTPEQMEHLLSAGKKPKVDPATGEVLTTSLRDSLPAGWRLEPEKGAPQGARADSMGNAIVNETPGLPAWAQRDVDALRASIVRWRDAAAAARAQGRDAGEAEGVLGNFLGQALARSIDVDDLVNIDVAKVMNERVAGSIMDCLHFYEGVRFANQGVFGYVYEPAAYPARVREFVARHGGDLDVLQQVEPTGGMQGRGGVPSGCYERTTFTRGMTALSGQTDIWTADGTDDASADIPTGFPLFFFYDCDDAGNNDAVRVSSNGYISFFQRGGGAVDGTNFTNDAITDSADPDGFIAPWWDDLFIAPNQGNTDRVSYKTEGAVDQRVFTVEWFSVSRLNGSTDEFHFFQVKLYETTDIVELHYGLDFSGWQPDTLDNATVGMENYTGTAGDCGPNCDNTNSAPPPNNYRFSPSPRPGNDTCAGATAILNGASVFANLHRATAEGVAGCDQGTNRDLWYTYTATCAGTVRIDTCGSRDIGGANNGIDTVLAVYSACPATPNNQVACNDDAGAAGCSAVDSLVDVPVSAGQQLWIRVSHFGDLAFRFASGEFQLHVNLDATASPGNDSCGSAQSLVNGSSVTGNILCASNDGEAGCGSAATNPDIWYRFVAPFTGRLTVDTCGSRDNAGSGTGPDTVASIHTGCPGEIGNQLACNDDASEPGCNALDSSVSAILTAGQNVRVRVSHFGSSEARVRNGVVRVHATFACVADFNHNGVVNSQDFFDFLSAFFAGQLSADVNLDTFINSQDFFDFLTAFFAGC
jgi:hypothetical protein